MRSAINAPGGPLGRGSGYVAAGLIALAMFFVTAGRPINIDTAWYLVAIRKWLDGAPLYAEILEVNPPLAFYLATPAVFLADLLGLGDMDAMFLYLAILVGGALAWVWALALRSGLSLDRRAALFLAAAAAMLVAPKFYGQREHLLVILTMPWFVGHVLAKRQSGPAAIGRAAVASVGLCLKPHFLLIPAGLTLAECLRARSLRPVTSASNLTIAAAGVLYIGFVVVLHPAYFEQLVPIALDVYGDYSFGARAVLQTAQVWLFALFVVVALAAHRRGAEALAPIVAAAVGALAAYFAQWNGFPYHLLPALAFMTFGFVWLVARPGAAPLLRLVSAAGLLAIGLQATAFNQDRFTEALSPRFAEFPQPIRYMAFSTVLDVAFPFVLTAGAEWTSRGPALWFLPAVVNGLEAGGCEPDAERCERLRDIEARMRDVIMEDIGRNEPNVVVFLKHNYFLRDPGFDIRAYLARDPRFQAWLAGFDLVEDGPGYSLWIKP